jgi:hypothetical protein
MDDELLQRVALVQRDHWRAIAIRAEDYLGTQLEDGRTHEDGFDAANASPRDWADFWNLHVHPSKSY